MLNLKRWQKLQIRINGKIQLTNTLYAGYCKLHKTYYQSKLHGCHIPVLYCPSCIREYSLKQKKKERLLDKEIIL